MSRTIKTEAEFGGKPCEGESSIEETCNIRECPGIEIFERYGTLETNVNIIMTLLRNLIMSSNLSLSKIKCSRNRCGMRRW